MGYVMIVKLEMKHVVIIYAYIYFSWTVHMNYHEGTE
jgi:hypothetical protein